MKACHDVHNGHDVHSDKSFEQELLTEEGMKKLLIGNKTAKQHKGKEKKQSRRIQFAKNSSEQYNPKNCLSSFETRNLFNLFNNYTEEEIETIICCEMVAKSEVQNKNKFL